MWTSYSYSLMAVAIFALDVAALIGLWSGHGTTEKKLLWTVAIVLLPVLGMFLYFAIGRAAEEELPPRHLSPIHHDDERKVMP